MADAHRARIERRAIRVAQTTPVRAAGARRSPSLVVNAATDPKVQEQQGSSQPVTERRDGRTATPSLVRGFGGTSHARSEIPHGRHALDMATELLYYRPAPDRHHDRLQCIEELVAAATDSATLSCSFRPQPSEANDKEQDAPPPPPQRDVRPEPRHEARLAINLTSPGRGQDMKPVVSNAFMPFGLRNAATTYQRLQRAMLVPRLLGCREEDEETLGPTEGPEPREAADP
ncbi:hypothetical protein D1007_29143 [Hordeum vulgare]|nr:hypothetical protein D1007_29143 [Hordeum vulgare]